MNSKYTEKVEPRLNELSQYLAAGNPESGAAGFLGISLSSLRRYRKRYAELEEIFQQRHAICDELVEAALLKRATGYEDNSGKEVAPDVRAAVFWLQNRRPDKWKPEKGSGSKNSVTVELSDLEKRL